jgi:hypothetical protein
MSLRLLLAFLVSMLPAAVGALDLDLGSGALPLDHTPASPLSADAADQIVIMGHVSGPLETVVVLRVDDTHSAAYPERVNIERTLPPGPFSWTLPLVGLKTSGGRLLNSREIRRLVLFGSSGSSTVSVERFQIKAASTLPGGAQGFSFGPEGAPLLAGFQRVAASDPRLETNHPVSVTRPGLDPLIASGIKGIKSFRLPLAPGRYRISLWTEDVGEWETLPAVLQRQIRINGVEVSSERLSPMEWIRSRYLAGRDREPSPSPDAWEVHGRHRGGLISAEIVVDTSEVLVELAGDNPDATFLSAALVEQAGQQAALDAVQEQRATWFRSTYTIGADESKLGPSVPVYSLPAAAVTSLHGVTARGAGLRVEFALSSRQMAKVTEFEIVEPENSGHRLPMQIWAAQKRLTRKSVGGNMLVRRDDVLRADPTSLPIQADEPRRYIAWIRVPDSASPGNYSGAVRLITEAGEIKIPIDVNVLAVDLPAAPRAAGFYLDEAPHLTWFPLFLDDRKRQIACDFDTLSQFGINGNAPPLRTPIPDRMKEFTDDAQSADYYGTVAPWLAYTPAKRILAAQGVTAGAQLVAAASAQLRDIGISPPIWSVADEPSNPDQSSSDLYAWMTALRRADPQIKLAAQLNSSHDHRMMHLFDTVIINDGFGIDVDDVAEAGRGRDVWIYNTSNPRLAAGFWLWRTGASRYIQWHARMPTADPFDPTDGREGDVEMFLPSAEVCGRPDVTTSLIAMAEGIVDQRWLAWLEQQREPQAIELLHRLRDNLGSSWKGVSPLSDDGLDRFRGSITELAQIFQARRGSSSGGQINDD